MTKFLKHDAMHLPYPMKNREHDFEWWYFDAELDTGDHVVAMYSSNDTRLSPRQPSVRLNIYGPDGREITRLRRYDEDQISLSYDKCDTRMGEDFCVDNGDHFEFRAMNDGHGFRLKMYKDFEHWVIGKTAEEIAMAPMGWTISVPQGRVEGVIVKDGIETPVSGSGYHDHNWGEKPMSAGFRNWYWGKLHMPEYAVDYSIMIPRVGEEVLGTCLVFSKDGVVIDPVFNREGLVIKASIDDIVPADKSALGLPYAQTLKLNATQGDFEIDITIAVDRIVMAERPLIETAPAGEPAYRYIGDESIRITQGGESQEFNTKALHEIVYLLNEEDQYKGYES